MESDRRKNIILGITGSVASIKLQELVDALTQTLNVNICIVPTKSSLHFVPEFDQLCKVSDLSERLALLKDETAKEKIVLSFSDEDEWNSWHERSDPVLHIELKKWADLLLVAPLDANTMGKLANGLCDNLLTCVARAWDIEAIETKPVVVCPSMNTYMFRHPITGRQLRVLSDEFGFTVVDCVEKRLMCGDVGLGAMASVDTIVATVKDLL
jgi:phosphopantothenoylcysteine decarboxylase